MGGVLGVVLIAALVYYFYTQKQKQSQGIGGNDQNATGNNTASTQSASYGTSISQDPNIVARWWQYSEVMKRIQQNLNDTCLSAPKISVDGELGAETIAGIRRLNTNYAQKLASDIEASKQVTQSQADWLLKKCTTSVGSWWLK